MPSSRKCGRTHIEIKIKEIEKMSTIGFLITANKDSMFFFKINAPIPPIIIFSNLAIAAKFLIY